MYIYVYISNIYVYDVNITRHKTERVQSIQLATE